MKQIPRTRLSLRRNLIAVSVAAILFGVAASAYAWWRETPSLFSLLPANTVGMAEVDAPWVWKASAKYRDQSQVKQMMLAMEMVTNINIEKDVLPWAGHIGAAYIPEGDKNAEPTGALFFEVRDLPSFGKSFIQFQNLTAKQASQKWKSANYKGVEIFTLNSGSASIETTMLKSWFIVGTAPAVKDVIDTYQGNAPSLEKSEAWSAALNTLSEDKSFAAAFDCGKLITKMEPNAAGAESLNNMKKFTQLVEAISLTDKGDGLRMDVGLAPTSPEMKDYMANCAKIQRPVSPDQFKQIPNDATAAFVSGGLQPGWETAVNQMLQVFGKQLNEPFSKDLPVPINIKKVVSLGISLIKPFTHGGTTSIIANKQDGVGVYVTGQTDSPEKAADAADRLQLFLRAYTLDVDEHDGVYTVDLASLIPAKTLPFDLSPEFAASGDTLKFVSSRKLLDLPKGQSKLQFPAGAEGAISVSVGNFDFLQMLPQTPDVTKVVDSLKISNANWACYSNQAVDGSYESGTIIINNWDYHDGIDTVVKIIADENAAEAKRAAEQQRARAAEVRAAHAKAAAKAKAAKSKLHHKTSTKKTHAKAKVKK